MKLLKLTIENIHSLYGKTEIDFQEGALSETGLFAITGDTGAGKSTILDAITIVLFRQIARNGADVRDSLSRGTANGMVELLFEGKDNKKYKSVWSVRRARNNVAGELQNQQVELSYAETGEILASQIREFDRMIPEVLGLSFEQFKRTVLLAQGDFATFFKANDNERAEILEKLTQTEIFRQLSIKCYYYTKGLNDELDLLKAQNSSISILDEEQLTQLNAELDALNSDSRTKESDAKAVREQLVRVGNISALEKDINTGETELSALTASQNEKQSLFKKAEEQNAARPAFELWDRIKESLSSKDELTKSLQAYTEDEELFGIRQKELDKTLEEKQKNYKSAQENQETKAPLLQVALGLSSDLSRIKSEGKEISDQKTELERRLGQLESDILNIDLELTKKLNSKQEIENKLSQNLDIKTISGLLQSLKIKQATYGRIETSLEEKAKSISNLEVQNLSKNKSLTTSKNELEKKTAKIDTERVLLQTAEAEKSLLLNDQTLISLKEEKDSLSQSLSALPSWKEKIVYASSREQELSEKRGKCEKIAEELQQIHVSIEEKQAQVERASETFHDKQKIRDLNAKVRFYEEDRKNLKDGDPCPLCGSEKHQVHLVVDSGDLDKVESDYQKADKELKLRQDELGALKDQALKLNTSLEEKQQQLSDLEEQIPPIRKNATDAELWLNKLRTKYQIEPNHEEEYLNEKLGEAADLLLKIEEKEATIDSLLQSIQEAEQGRNPLQVQIAELETDIRANGERLAEEQKAEISLKSEIASLENELKGLAEAQGMVWSPDLVTELEKSITEIEDLQNQLNGLSESINESNSSKSKTLQEIDFNKKQIKEKENDRAKKLEEYTAVQEKRRAILPDDKNPEQELNILENDKKSALDLKDQAQTAVNLNKENIIQIQTKIESIKNRIEDAEKDTQRLEIELNNLLKNLNLNEVYVKSETRLSDLELKNLLKEKQGLETALSVKMEMLQSKKEKLQAEKDKGFIEKSEETLSAELNLIENSLNEINQKIGGINQTLASNNEAIKNAESLIKKIEEKQKEYNQWNALNIYIGSASGDKFVKVAQWFTLAHLTKLANKQLKQLTDRYLLSNNTDQSKLDLWVTDTYQSDAIRSVSSLSGGESFLVSLAMALGLSQMASGQTKIDSLFIDEGFGTLDSNTLEIALNSLERLQNQGKTIGIISHVPQLKERISTQIQVVKKGRGRSVVEIKQG